VCSFRIKINIFLGLRYLKVTRLTYIFCTTFDLDCVEVMNSYVRACDIWCGGKYLQRLCGTYFDLLITNGPALLKACLVLDRSDTGIVGSNLTRGMDVRPRVCVRACVL
jgi:hypothetical protein